MIDLSTLFQKYPSFLYLSGEDALSRPLEISPNIPLAIQPNSENFLAVKDLLISSFGGDKTVAIFGSGVKEGELSSIEFEEGAVYVLEPLPLEKKRSFGFSDIIAIMKRLRAPDGCEWDRAQSHSSISINMIEEAYELVEAIDLGDFEKIREEAGDVLLQAVFHAVMAEEAGEFSVADMLTALGDKLISRHTHIFGEDKAKNAAEALAFWEKSKAREKGEKNFSDKVDFIPKNLPALLYAEKVQKAVKKCGFDWENAEGCFEKLYEEIEELKAAGPKEIEIEGGDVIFSAVNVLRKLGLDAETALRKSTEKFVKRFKNMETELAKDGKKLTDFSLDELEEAWQRSKKFDNI
jgi:tetrapyrrole methylase family protein/MazG family protein